MKKLLTLILLLVPALTWAQDVILLRENETIEAKVLEVSGGKVWYKKFSNPNGPTFDIGLSEILRVEYEKGAPPKRKELPPVPPELMTNPWQGKFRFGLRADAGVTGLFYNRKAPVYATFFGVAGYGECHTKTKSNLLLGVGVGYRYTIYDPWMIRRHDWGFKRNGVAHVGTIVTDLYAGFSSRFIRWNPSMERHYVQKAILVARFGGRLLTNVSEREKLSITPQETFRYNHLESLRPLQAGVFVQLGFHFKHLQIGLDANLIFTNLHKRKGYYVNLTSTTVSCGLFLGYTL